GRGHTGESFRQFVEHLPETEEYFHAADTTAAGEEVIVLPPVGEGEDLGDGRHPVLIGELPQTTPYFLCERVGGYTPRVLSGDDQSIRGTGVQRTEEPAFGARPDPRQVPVGDLGSQRHGRQVGVQPL